MIRNPVEPVAKLHRVGPADCIVCGAPMPPIKPKGRIPIYCSSRCRKAAYEARREARPDAFRVEIIETRTLADHPLNTCVENALGSPRAFRRMLTELAAMVDRDQLIDPRWQPIETELGRLQNALQRREERRHLAHIKQQKKAAQGWEQLRTRQQEDAQKRSGLPEDFQL
jgi:predicted nucleic acid-binding Zn ribbon protein